MYSGLNLKDSKSFLFSLNSHSHRLRWWTVDAFCGEFIIITECVLKKIALTVGEDMCSALCSIVVIECYMLAIFQFERFLSFAAIQIGYVDNKTSK